jgi:hypothetical protein
MNSSTQNDLVHNSNSGAGSGADVDVTLRLIARLPAPDGLEDRVIAGLKTGPKANSGSARILYWPELLQPAGSWMRGVAAAAIVFVVAGGGWGIYTRVQPSQPARVIAMPPRAGAGGGFSSAGAMRTPQTLNGPVLAQPITAPAPKAKPLKKASAAGIAPAPQSGPQTAAASKAPAQPADAEAK